MDLKFQTQESVLMTLIKKHIWAADTSMINVYVVAGNFF